MQDAAGDFEVYKYNPSENAFDGSSMGAVGPAWTVVGIAPIRRGRRRCRRQFHRATRPGDGVDGANAASALRTVPRPVQSFRNRPF